MIELKWAREKGFVRDIGISLYRVYYRAAYRTSKAILAPVVGVISDVIHDAVTDAVRQGIQTALPKPIFHVGEFLVDGLDSFRRK